MRLTIAYSKIKKRNLVLINNDTHQRETLSELPIRPPLSSYWQNINFNEIAPKFHLFAKSTIFQVLLELFRPTASTV